MCKNIQKWRLFVTNLNVANKNSQTSIFMSTFQAIVVYFCSNIFWDLLN